jgi:hypothetical protein
MTEIEISIGIDVSLLLYLQKYLLLELLGSAILHLRSTPVLEEIQTTGECPIHILYLHLMMLADMTATRIPILCLLFLERTHVMCPESALGVRVQLGETSCRPTNA